MNHIINWVIQINGTFLFHIHHINHINKHGNLDFIHSFRNCWWIFELHLVLKLTVFIKYVSSVGNGPWIWGHIRKVKINLDFFFLKNMQCWNTVQSLSILAHQFANSFIQNFLSDLINFYLSPCFHIIFEVFVLLIHSREEAGNLLHW